MEEYAVFGVEAREGMSLWVFVLRPDRAHAFLSVANLDFNLLWMMPPVQFVILRTLFRDGATFEGCALGVYHLVLAPFLSKRIMV